MSLLIRLLVTSAALYAATQLVDGITYTGPLAGLLGVALVFGAVNAFIAPILKFFSFPVIFLTLGFFALVINAGMLLLTARLATSFGFAFSVSGFWPAFWGALVVSIVSAILGRMFRKDDRKRKDG